MKTVITTLALCVSATLVQAGPVAYASSAAPVIIEESAMGGFGMWLIPLLAIALIALAMKTSGNGPVDDPIGL